MIADPDRDSNTEILIGSNNNCNIICPEIDPIHAGVRCENGADCLSGSCDSGFCRCSGNAQCDENSRCEAPPAGTPGSGNTCRAYHPPGVDLTGVRVLRDRLDRWASSRPLWNQHAYSVTNIEADGRVPKTSAWKQNFATAGLNNYRQNVQGAASVGTAPDITGKLDADKLCQQRENTVEVTGVVCNRGSRAVGAAMPAAFYAGNPSDGKLLCVAFTAGPVAVGDCMPVSCVLPETVMGLITMVTNDDGSGGRTTLECNNDNNGDTTVIDECVVIK